jgi:hypothetical protein
LRRYQSPIIRAIQHEAGLRSCIPAKSNRKAKIRWNRRMYRERNRIERLIVATDMASRPRQYLLQAPRYAVSLLPLNCCTARKGYFHLAIPQSTTFSPPAIPSQIWLLILLGNSRASKFLYRRLSMVVAKLRHLFTPHRLDWRQKAEKTVKISNTCICILSHCYTTPALAS